jgi:hypothetical protein
MKKTLKQLGSSLFLINTLTRLYKIWNFYEIKNILNFDVPNHFLTKIFRKITLVMFFEVFGQKHFWYIKTKMFDIIETLEEVLASKAQAI